MRERGDESREEKRERGRCCCVVMLRLFEYYSLYGMEMDDG